MEKDLTKGSPFKVILLFSLPMLLSMMFQQLYNIVDSVVAGQFIGKSALASVSASFPITMLFIAVATGCSIGSSVIISQLYGLKDHDRLKSAIYTALIAIVALAALLTVVGVFICTPILRLMNTPASIMGDSKLYLDIYIYGLVFLFLYNAVTAIYTGLGDSKTPLYFLIFSSVLNIGLDILFVTAFKMGVGGVAWATFIAQGIASLLAGGCLIKKVGAIKTSKKVKIFDTGILKKIAIVAVPSICQQSFISIGQLLVQTVINGFSEDIISGYGAAIKVNIFAVASFNTLSSALSAYTGQNIGAREITRIKKGYINTLLIGGAVCAVFIVLFLTLGGKLIGLFVSSAEDVGGVIDAGQMFLWIAAAGYPIVSLKLVTDGVLRGSGDMTGFMIATFTDLIIRVVLSFVLAPVLGFMGVCLTYPIGWAGGMIVSLCLYFAGKWKKKIKV